MSDAALSKILLENLEKKFRADVLRFHEESEAKFWSDVEFEIRYRKASEEQLAEARRKLEAIRNVKLS